MILPAWLICFFVYFGVFQRGWLISIFFINPFSIIKLVLATLGADEQKGQTTYIKQLLLKPISERLSALVPALFCFGQPDQAVSMRATSFDITRHTNAPV